MWQVLTRDLVDRLPYGVILADGSARILEMNRCANQLVGTEQGLAVRDGRIVATESGVDAALQRSIVRTIELSGEGSLLQARVLVPVPRKRRAMQVVVASTLRFPQEARSRDGVVVLFLFGVDGLPVESTTLAGLYGLTPAESQVAGLLVAGERLVQIGAATGTTLNTVRTHIRRIFSKSGCRTQAEFVHAVLTGPAMLRGQLA